MTERTKKLKMDLLNYGVTQRQLIEYIRANGEPNMCESRFSLIVNEKYGDTKLSRHCWELIGRYMNNVIRRAEA